MFFSYLEYIDAENLTRTEREQQDFHFIGTRQSSPGIDTIQQIFILNEVHHQLPLSHATLTGDVSTPRRRASVSDKRIGSNLGTYSSTPTDAPSF